MFPATLPPAERKATQQKKSQRHHRFDKGLAKCLPGWPMKAFSLPALVARIDVQLTEGPIGGAQAIIDALEE